MSKRLPVESLKPGSSAYHRGCRCARCREWKAQQMRLYRERRVARGLRPQGGARAPGAGTVKP